MDILPFNFEDNQIRTLKDEKGEIWFNAKDVLIILKPDISNGTKDLDEDEKRRFKIVSGDQTRQMTFVSESGLYSLIMRSRKPIAKPFQKCITRDVLPSIRKTGKYEIKNSQSTQPIQTQQTFDNFNFAKQTQQNREILDFIELINSQSLINLFFLDKIYKHFGVNSPLNLLQIDLNSYYFIPTELGKFLNKSAVDVNKILEAKGFQEKIDGFWILTEEGKNYAIQLDNNFKTIKWKLESLI